MERKQQQIFGILAKSVRQLLEQEGLDMGQLQEIRMRIGKPLLLIYQNEERFLPFTKGKHQRHIVTREEIRETLDYVSHYSLYAYERDIRQGFLTVEGGHRIGVMGKVIMEQNTIKNLQYISSVNVRVSHEIRGCADHILPYITKEGEICHTLIISPPRCGKTTLLRDLIRQISDGNMEIPGHSVGVVDERSELGGCYHGVAQNDLGIRTDILDGCPKAEGMLLLIRSMAPQVIAVDEIGAKEDIHALEYAMQCGCRMIATVHGKDMKEAAEKPVLGELIQKRRFQRYIVLGNRQRPGEIRAVYDERGSVLCCGL
ncbi:MAG: stage III sporulation protein AA [Ruminococcus sp.]|nr:stage III sporulation protein AA [Ruminococcus sp.]